MHPAVGVCIASDVRHVSVLKEERWIKAVAPRMIIVPVVILPTVATDACACCRKAPFKFSDLSSGVSRFLCNLRQEDIIGIGLESSCMKQLRNLTQC